MPEDFEEFTISATMITEMRGADSIVFELILICSDCIFNAVLNFSN